MSDAETPSSRAGWNWQATWTDLPEGFSELAVAAPAPDPRGVLLNDALAAELGLSPAALAGDAGAAVLTGRKRPTNHPPRLRGARRLAQTVRWALH